MSNVVLHCENLSPETRDRHCVTLTLVHRDRYLTPVTEFLQDLTARLTFGGDADSISVSPPPSNSSRDLIEIDSIRAGFNKSHKA